MSVLLCWCTSFDNVLSSELFLQPTAIRASTSTMAALFSQMTIAVMGQLLISTVVDGMLWSARILSSRYGSGNGMIPPFPPTSPAVGRTSTRILGVHLLHISATEAAISPLTLVYTISLSTSPSVRSHLWRDWHKKRLSHFLGGDRAGQADVYSSAGCPSTCVGECILVFAITVL